MYIIHCLYRKTETQDYENKDNKKNYLSMSNKKKILLVDDEPDITSSLKIGLEDNGFAVDTFNDAMLALSNFKTGMYDLVLLDVKMPQINDFVITNNTMMIYENYIPRCAFTCLTKSSKWIGLT